MGALPHTALSIGRCASTKVAARSRVCHRQIRTLIIEDEFTDPTNSAHKDFAKNALQVEGVDDIWCAARADICPTMAR